MLDPPASRSHLSRDVVDVQFPAHSSLRLCVFALNSACCFAALPFLDTILRSAGAARAPSLRRLR